MRRAIPVFLLVALSALLLLNDLLLKATYHNWWTGKLSDVLWLFLFPLCFSWFFPAWRRPVYLLTAIGFACWKSSFFNPALDAFISVTGVPLGRVTDATDVLALIVLPLSYACTKKELFASGLTVKFVPLNSMLLAGLLFSVLACEAPDMMDDKDRQITSNYYWERDYDCETQWIERKVLDDNYVTVLGPHVLKYGWNNEFIIAKLNPVLIDTADYQTHIDTSRVEFAIICVPANQNTAEAVYDHLTGVEFKAKRKELNVPDSLRFTR